MKIYKLTFVDGSECFIDDFENAGFEKLLNDIISNEWFVGDNFAYRTSGIVKFDEIAGSEEE